MGELTQRERDALCRICGKLGGGEELRLILELTDGVAEAESLEPNE